VLAVPIARATFDSCAEALGAGATLPEPPAPGVYRVLGPRGAPMIRGVVLSGCWFRGGQAWADAASVGVLSQWGRFGRS
jgi:hypothetical protein